MPLSLIVAEPFADYQRGDVITDPAIIEAVRSGENAARVVQVSDEVVAPPPTTPILSPLAGVLLGAWGDDNSLQYCCYKLYLLNIEVGGGSLRLCCCDCCCSRC